MIEEQLKEAKLACRKMQNIDKYTKIKSHKLIGRYKRCRKDGAEIC